MRGNRLLPALFLLLLLPSSGAQSAVTTYFHETDAVFANPGQGWFHDQWQQPRLPASVTYLRFDWQLVEPVDGTFNWTLIDKTIAEARLRHETVAMRVMTANAHSDGFYSSPKWLFDEGCKGFVYANDGADSAQGGKPMQRIEPNYADPLYLAKHAAFMRALGERYNGSPDIEFLDIGSYGIWGEWHTTHPVSIRVRQQIVDMYLHAFSHTPLVYMSDDADVMGYALAHGAGLRRDGVGDPWHEQRWAGTPAYANVPAMGDAWKHAPIVFEWFLDYDYMLGKGWSFDAAVSFMLKNHVTMIHDNLGVVPPEVLPKLDKLARLAGYRFVLREWTQPPAVHAGETLSLSMKWANVGVGKLYRSGDLTLRLRDATGRIVSATVAAADPREWLPGDHSITAELPLAPGLARGDYTLEVAMLDSLRQRAPLHLAFDAPEQDGWYTLGKVPIN